MRVILFVIDALILITGVGLLVVAYQLGKDKEQNEGGEEK